MAPRSTSASSPPVSPRGHQVGVVVSEPSPLATRLHDHGIEVLPWRSIVREPNLVHDVRARRELRAAIARLCSAKAGVIGRALPGDHRTVYTCHHAPFGPRQQWSHRVVARPVEQLTLRHADGIICHGARDIPLLRKLAPSTPSRLVRNAVPLGSELARRVRHSPSRHNVELLGRVDDLEPLYAQSSLFLLTTACPLRCGGPANAPAAVAALSCDRATRSSQHPLCSAGKPTTPTKARRCGTRERRWSS